MFQNIILNYKIFYVDYSIFADYIRRLHKSYGNIALCSLSIKTVNPESSEINTQLKKHAHTFSISTTISKTGPYLAKK